MVDGIGSSVNFFSPKVPPISLRSLPSQTGPNQPPLHWELALVHFGTLTVNTSVSGVRDAANE